MMGMNRQMSCIPFKITIVREYRQAMSISDAANQWIYRTGGGFFDPPRKTSPGPANPFPLVAMPDQSGNP